MNISDYYDAGLKVFALYGIVDGKCACGNENCDALLKHPNTKNWQETPTWDNEQFETMLKYGVFETGFGVLCNHSLLVVDIDPRNGGNESFERLCNDLGFNLKDKSQFIVSTGGGGWHLYFKYNSDIVLRKVLKKYAGIEFITTGYVVGSSSLHKSGLCYETEKGSPYDICEPPIELIDILKRETIEFESSSNQSISDSEITKMLESIPPDDYQVWIEIGIALKYKYGQSGFEIWDKWSSKSAKYDFSNMMYKWSTFDTSNHEEIKDGIIKYWYNSFTYETSVTFDPNENEVNLDLEEVDLTKCYGLVGEVIDFFNARSRFDRFQLAVSASLALVSSLGGLHCIDEEFGAMANCAFFNVSGSATGKENIQQTQRDLMTIAGAKGCTYGSIKSEQEMFKTLIDHQLNVYVIDEFGISLKKIVNSGGTSSGSYLEGIPSAIMQIYSKSDGIAGISSDHIKDVISKVTKKITDIEEDDPQKEEKKEIYSDLLNEIKQHCGFKESFMNICGYTTPVTFNNLMNFELATNGFFGRALVFEEKDDHPKPKKRFKKIDIPLSLELKLKELFSNGEASYLKKSDIRITASKNKRIVKTDKDASDLLDYLQDYFYDWGTIEKEESGLHAIIRRCFELVLKISLIIAIGDGHIRKRKHVVWAYHIVKRDAENKILMVKSNLKGDSKEEIISKIMHSLDKKVPISVRAIYRSKRSLGKENVEKALNYLVKEGLAVEIEVKPTRGKPTIQYLKA